MDLQKVSKRKRKVIEANDKIAGKRDRYIRRNRYYYDDLLKFFSYNIPTNTSVLEIGCATGEIIGNLNVAHGTGIDISPRMIEIAQKKYPHLVFYTMDAENLALDQTFDYIIISDTLGYFEDIQQAFELLLKVTHAGTRIIITYHNFMWQPFLKIAEILRLKMPQKRLNWLNETDINNILHIAGLEIVKQGRRFLFPKYLPLISWFMNKYIAHLPLINSVCLTGYSIARKASASMNKPSVSIIIPARNEKGNIKRAVEKIPEMGTHTEIIFIEGHSSDGTLEEIQNVAASAAPGRDISYAVQNGRGKGDAVRLGFSMAKNDILMILDADLTVDPSELPKFFDALAGGAGEFVNGSRLVYPMEKEAMQTLNMFGNKFFSTMFSWILGQRLKDTLCGTKVLSRENWKKIEANRSYFGEFDPFGDFDMLFGAAKLNLKIVEVPVRYRARTYGTTNISRFRHGLLLFEMMLFAMNKIKFA
ncbi:MAG: glycosyltransferase [Chitinivibrionales bacterium]|nr:glycosyltransferase [Chitinivibrionales bacterium]